VGIGEYALTLHVHVEITYSCRIILLFHETSAALFLKHNLISYEHYMRAAFIYRLELTNILSKLINISYICRLTDKFIDEFKSSYSSVT
jgi:hypothetical protein